MTTESPDVDADGEGNAPETGAETGNPDVKSPEESSAGEGSERNLLDVVSDAAGYLADGDDEDEGDGDSPSQQAEEGADAEGDGDQTKAADDAGDPDDAELTDEEFASLKPKTRKSIDRLRGKVKEQGEQIASLQPQADQYRQIEGFMRQHGLSSERTAGFLELAAQLQAVENGSGDIDSAIKTVGQMYKGLLEVSGRLLPPDLKKKVDEGFLDEKQAREISASRAETMRARKVAERSQRTEQTTRQEQQRQSLRTAAGTWEANVKAKDPDYGRKAELVEANAAALMRKYGEPRNATEVNQLLERAYADANKTLKAFVPKPAATLKRPGSDSAASGKTQPRPASLYEVVERAANGGE